MLRFPAARRALTTVGAAATATSATAAQVRLKTQNFSNTCVTSENRLTTWCRRLWGLANESGHLDAGVSIPQAATAVSHLAATGTTRTGSSSRVDTWTSSADFSTISAEELIRGLREVVEADTTRLPSVLVETIWDVYDAILPPEVRRDMSHTLNAASLNNFFSFVGLLTEMDFDLGAVRRATERLSSVVADYEKVSGEVTDFAKTHNNFSSDARDGGAAAAAPTVTQLEERAALADKLAQAKGAVIKACFKARNAGSPLYYTWLRHTASTEGGLLRLMNFRKAVHFFDVECKKRIKTLRSERAKTAEADGDSSNGSRPATEQEQQLSIWLKRERDIHVIDASLTSLFHDFFSKEYLIMEELSWFSTPPSMLEQLIVAEAVHPFQRGLLDMQGRLQPTHHRHLFAFLHPAVVDEPLIAVQVALTKGISGSVDYILGRATPLADPANTTAHGLAFQQHLAKYGPDTSDKERVDTAIFYSINSAQSALRGMDMGNMLIKRVVREIEENINASRGTRKLMPITQFSTLSPIPGYVRWLSGEVERLNNFAHKASRNETQRVDPAQARIFGECPSTEELEARYYKPVRDGVLAFASRHDMSHEAESIARLKAAVEKQDLVLANAQALKFLIRQFLAPNVNSPWWLDHELTKVLEKPMLRSAAHYLYKEKKKRNKHILDPVGNFHVSNGATIFRVNFLGNTTTQGSRESGCMMVNYWYNTQTIGDNVAAYERSKTVAVDGFVSDLLRNDSDA